MIEFRVSTDIADLPHITYLAREAHLESRFGYIPFSEAKVKKIVERAMADTKRFGFLLAFRRGEPVGFAYLSVSEYHIGTDVLLASIHNINVLKTFRGGLSGGRAAVGLFRGAQSWSKTRGAKEILLHITSGVNLSSAERLATKLGYRNIGGSYAKAI